MTEPAVNTAGTAASAVVAEPPPVAAPPAAPSAPADGQEPHWLAGRLERERKAVLRDLGIEDPKDAKAALAELKTRRDAEKTAAQLQSEELAALKPQAARVAKLEATIKARADVELAALTDAQRAAVASVAGEDASSVLSAIDALKPTWAQQSAPAAAAVETPVANTAPPRTAPGTKPSPTTNHTAEFAALRETNPFAAAQYAERFGALIAAGK